MCSLYSSHARNVTYTFLHRGSNTVSFETKPLSYVQSCSEKKNETRSPDIVFPQFDVFKTSESVRVD